MHTFKQLFLLITLQFILATTKEKNGGAIYLSRTTILFNATTSNTQVYFTNNTAQRGGAIYVNNEYTGTGTDTDFDDPEADNTKLKIMSIFNIQCDVKFVK